MENKHEYKLMTKDAEELLTDAISDAMAIEGEEAVFNFLKGLLQSMTPESNKHGTTQ